jgi:hypothetical protein
MVNKLEIIKIFDHLTYQQTVFSFDNSFTSDELKIFSFEDRLKIWEPDGDPFFGDFDIYLKVFKDNKFKGFYRIEVFPWGELNLHIGFPTSKSFVSRYYLTITDFFLRRLIPISKKFDIYCIFRDDNKNVLKYMAYFNFLIEEPANNQNRYKFNLE